MTQSPLPLSADATSPLAGTVAPARVEQGGLAFAIPTVTTARLILREPRESDLDVMERAFRSESSRYVGGPLNRRGSWRSLLSTIGHWALRGYGLWSVETKAGALVGRVGVIRHDGRDEPELGWHIYEGHEGLGYAHEAALAARAYASTVWGMGPLACIIAPENARSIALALRMGAQLESVISDEDGPLHLYRHPGVEDGGMEAYA